MDGSSQSKSILVAGRDLDVLVANRVLGCTTKQVDDRDVECGCPDRRHAVEYGIYYLPKYSTNGEASLRVLESMLAETFASSGREYKRYALTIEGGGMLKDWAVSFDTWVGDTHEARSEKSLAEAICLAALKAKSEKSIAQRKSNEQENSS